MKIPIKQIDSGKYCRIELFSDSEKPKIHI